MYVYIFFPTCIDLTYLRLKPIVHVTNLKDIVISLENMVDSPAPPFFNFSFLFFEELVLCVLG